MGDILKAGARGPGPYISLWIRSVGVSMDWEAVFLGKFMTKEKQNKTKQHTF